MWNPKLKLFLDFGVFPILVLSLICRFSFCSGALCVDDKPNTVLKTNLDKISEV